FAPGLIGIDLTSDAAGLGSWVGANPANPALAGVTVSMNALWFWAGACPLGPFSLSSSRGLAITYEL
ncbi:MAG TPA: hypothetical protein VKE69_06655, partial [Planctomycetota bacterium]|nr:hypothetical protein [Planctomycetota bacterium]